MAKKLLGIIVAAAMTMSLLAGCGSTASAPAEAEPEEAAEAVEEAAEEEEEEPAEEAAEEETEDAAEAEEEEASADSGYAVNPEDLSIGILLPSTHDDGGFSQSLFEGFVGALDELGIDKETQLTYLENVDADTVQIASSAEELVGAGCNVVIGGSANYSVTFPDLIGSYPDVMFACYGMDLGDVCAFLYRTYEPMYAIGYMMAKMALEEGSNNLGYVAGVSESTIRQSINGFAMGAKAANPDAKVQVVWTSSWYDPTAEAEAAKTLLSSDVKYMVTGCDSPGASQACEAGGGFCACVDRNRIDYAPAAMMACFTYDWTEEFRALLERYLKEGKYVDFYCYGAAEGCAQIAFNDDLVTAEQQAEAQDVLDKIGSGEIVMFEGPLYDNEGNELVPEGSVMDDHDILLQEFLVDNVVGSWS